MAERNFTVSTDGSTYADVLVDGNAVVSVDLVQNDGEQCRVRVQDGAGSGRIADEILVDVDKGDGDE